MLQIHTSSKPLLFKPTHPPIRLRVSPEILKTIHPRIRIYADARFRIYGSVQKNKGSKARKNESVEAPMQASGARACKHAWPTRQRGPWLVG
jgi:hypothetical protein